MKRQRTDEGMSLVELLVTMVLLTVVGTMVLATLLSVHKTIRTQDDESIGLNDVRTVTERLGRDVRDARSVVCVSDTRVQADGDPSCQSHLTLWIDSNSNYRQDSDEIVEWRLQARGDGQHYNVLRSTSSGTDVVEATSLVVLFGFSYDTGTVSSATQSVTTKMTYDAKVGQGTANRVVTFTDRLRNVS